MRLDTLRSARRALTAPQPGHRKRSPVRLLWGLTLLLLALIICAANLGAVRLPFSTLWQHAPDDMLWNIWLNIRLPRVLMAVLVGSALAVAGAIMQGVFSNPLADPGLLGLSSGAALCVGLGIVFPLALPAALALYSHTFAAFIGSLLVSVVIYILSRTGGREGVTRLLLAGIAINTLCGACTGILSYISDDQQLRQLSLWMMGSLGQQEWPMLGMAATLIVPAILLTLRLSQKMNLLQLGDEEAHYLGVNVAQTKRQLLLLSALLVGVAVSVSGIIGFIGLVIPHFIRMRIGASHRWLLPGAALGGALFLLLADTLARTIAIPAEIPVGLLTGVIGGPYFFWLILSKRRGGHA